MFLDIGVGIIAGIYFQTTETFSWGFLLFTVIAVLLPDIDMFWYWYSKRFGTNKTLDNHRSFTHYPILYIPISGLIYLFYDQQIATLFLVLIVYHFIHDTFFIGWGVKWFWPLSERSFKIFPDRNGKVTGKLILSWLPEEDQKIKEWAGSSNWVRSFYMTPNIIAYIEYPVFVFSIYYLVTTLLK